MTAVLVARKEVTMGKMKRFLQKLKKVSKKTWLIIAGAVVILAVAIVGVILTLNHSNEPTYNEDGTVTVNNEALTPPAKDTDGLKSQLEPLQDAQATSSDRIEFTSDKVNTGAQVAIWLYSEPKFIGFFTVKEENGKKYIDGLEQAIAELSIEAGAHNIAIVLNEDNRSIGYIDVYIEEGGKIKGDRPQESTSDNNEDNPQNSNSQTGGSNSNNGSGSNSGNSGGNSGGDNKPTQPVTPKAKYNLNDNIEWAYGGGGSCLSSEANADGWCDYAPSYRIAASLHVDNQAYIVGFGGNCGRETTKIRPIIATDERTFSYNGQTYTFNGGCGNPQGVLTESVCVEYGLSCDRW
jgi:flagellar basal body-associated protein FliL